MLLRRIFLAGSLAAMAAGCVTSSDRTSGGVFPCVWSDNGFAFYPFYYHSSADRGRSDTCWALCGLMGYRTRFGQMVSDWLVPLYARGETWFGSLPYTSVDFGRDGRAEFYFAGLGGLTRDGRGQVEQSWFAPFYYNGQQGFGTPFWGRIADSEWVMPCYYQNDHWFVTPFYATEERDDVSSLYSPLFGWTGEGSSRTNKWWVTPLFGTTTGDRNGWWLFPLYSRSADGDFDAKSAAASVGAVPAMVSFATEKVLDQHGDVSAVTVQRNSVRASDESAWLVFFDHDERIDDTFRVKDGRYVLARTRKTGNRFLLGYETRDEQVFDASTRRKISDRQSSSFSIGWRLFRHDCDSDDGNHLYLLYFRIY